MKKRFLTKTPNWKNYCSLLLLLFIFGLQTLLKAQQFRTITVTWTGGSDDDSLRHLVELLAHILDDFGRLCHSVREKTDEDVLLVALHVHARRRCTRLDDASGERTAFLLEESIPLVVELLRCRRRSGPRLCH